MQSSKAFLSDLSRNSQFRPLQPKMPNAGINLTIPLVQSANAPAHSIWCKKMLFSFSNKIVPNSISA